MAKAGGVIIPPPENRIEFVCCILNLVSRLFVGGAFTWVHTRDIAQIYKKTERRRLYILDTCLYLSAYCLACERIRCHGLYLMSRFMVQCFLFHCVTETDSQIAAF